MREQLGRRLQELKREYDAGQQALAELERQQAQLRETVLRISGAVQVLEEELGRAEQADTASGEPEGDTLPQPAVVGAVADGARPGHG